MTDSIDHAGEGNEKTEQNIFDEDPKTQEIELFDTFGKACDDNKITLSVAIILDQDNKPKVFYKGHIMDVAVLLAKVLREMKSQIMGLLHIN